MRADSPRPGIPGAQRPARGGSRPLGGGGGGGGGGHVTWIPYATGDEAAAVPRAHRRETLAWRCHQEAAGGDALDWIAARARLVRPGEPLRGDAWRAAIALAAAVLPKAGGSGATPGDVAPYHSATDGAMAWHDRGDCGIGGRILAENPHAGRCGTHLGMLQRTYCPAGPSSRRTPEAVAAHRSTRSRAIRAGETRVGAPPPMCLRLAGPLCDLVFGGQDAAWRGSLADPAQPAPISGPLRGQHGSPGSSRGEVVAGRRSARRGRPSSPPATRGPLSPELEGRMAAATSRLEGLPGASPDEKGPERAHRVHRRSAHLAEWPTPPLSSSPPVPHLVCPRGRGRAYAAPQLPSLGPARRGRTSPARPLIRSWPDAV